MSKLKPVGFFRSIFCLLFFIQCPSYASQCKNLLLGSQFDSHVKSLNQQALELEAHILPSVATVESLALLQTYYDLIDPSRLVQDIGATARQTYLSPLFEDRLLSRLSELTTDRIESFLTRKLFRPRQAIVVAMYLSGETQNPNLMTIARELINLKVEELSVLKLKEYIFNTSSRYGVPVVSEDDKRDILRFIRSNGEGSWLKHRTDVPVNIENIGTFKMNLRYGPLVNKTIVMYYELILNSNGFVSINR